MLTTLSRGPSAPRTDLVELLLECHERIRRFAAIAQRIGVDDGATPTERIEACRAVERYFTEALPLHVDDEEQSIQPRLSGTTDALDEALATMRAQHASHQSALTALLEACRAVRAAPGDAPRRQLLAERATLLIEAFEEHLGLEESVVLPAIAEHLSAAEQAEIIGELRARRRPGAAEAPATPGT